MSVVMTMVRDFRAGRMQRMLSAATAATALPLGAEIYMEHYGGSFGNKLMWAPVVLSPTVAAAGVAGVVSARAARTVLPLASVLYMANGLGGLFLHMRGIARRPGGLREPTYNMIMGPPVLAPGALTLIGAMGVAASIARRED